MTVGCFEVIEKFFYVGIGIAFFFMLLGLVLRYKQSRQERKELDNIVLENFNGCEVIEFKDQSAKRTKKLKSIKACFLMLFVILLCLVVFHQGIPSWLLCVTCFMTSILLFAPLAFAASADYYTGYYLLRISDDISPSDFYKIQQKYILSETDEPNIWTAVLK